MPDEFTPEASVDFEALAAAAAAEYSNGDGPHYAPPPEPPPAQAPPIRPLHADTNRPPRSGPSTGQDPFQLLEELHGSTGLIFRELGDLNAKLSILQLQTIVAFGSALLLAVLVWKLARPSP